MGTSYTELELSHVLEEVDTNRDGFINVDKFFAFCRSSSSASEIRDAFDLYNQDKNGVISAAELHQPHEITNKAWLLRSSSTSLLRSRKRSLKLHKRRNLELSLTELERKKLSLPFISIMMLQPRSGEASGNARASFCVTMN
ncbi:EF-hand domain pair protein [Raphanus sativus]|nr:EF-hand domain pair protein [Raphanus sativus]